MNMKLYISANTYTADQQEKTAECIRRLELLGHECLTENVAGSDMIVSVGGDGALLRAAGIALENDKPLIGINSGRVGHLCALKTEQIDEFDQVVEGCSIHSKTVLECVCEGKRFSALNDVIVGKDDFGRTVDQEVFVDGKKVMDIRGDGLIIATPTGSSAYNVSAGGPLVLDDSPILLITPICSHDTSVRPLIIPDDRRVTIRIRHEDAGIFADGRSVGKTSSDTLVMKSEKTLKLLQKD